MENVSAEPQELLSGEVPFEKLTCALSSLIGLDLFKSGAYVRSTFPVNSSFLPCKCILNALMIEIQNTFYFQSLVIARWTNHIAAYYIQAYSSRLAVFCVPTW